MCCVRYIKAFYQCACVSVQNEQVGTCKWEGLERDCSFTEVAGSRARGCVHGSLKIEIGVGLPGQVEISVRVR